MTNKNKIECTTKYQNEQQLTNSKNLVKYDAITPARTKQSASAEITNENNKEKARAPVF